MKIFQLCTGGETEFIASQNIIKAVIFYCQLTGFDETDFEDDDSIAEIPEDKWIDFAIRNDDYNIEDVDDWETKTFKEYMKDVTESELLASTAN